MTTDTTTTTFATLDELADALRSNAPEVLDRHGQWRTDLPTFGGVEPYSSIGVWSWDTTRLLVGECADDLEIVDRLSTLQWLLEGDHERIVEEILEDGDLDNCAYHTASNARDAGIDPTDAREAVVEMVRRSRDGSNDDEHTAKCEAFLARVAGNQKGVGLAER